MLRVAAANPNTIVVIESGGDPRLLATWDTVNHRRAIAGGEYRLRALTSPVALPLDTSLRLPAATLPATYVGADALAP